VEISSAAQTLTDMKTRGELKKQTGKGRDQARLRPGLELILPSVQNMFAKTDFLEISNRPTMGT